MFARTEETMIQRYTDFRQLYLNEYPALVNHVDLLWRRRDSWAMLFRVNALLRGNNTNNYAEKGIGIMKDIVFVRMQATNIVEVFFFIVERMDSYYQCRLAAIANEQQDHFISKRFKLLGWSAVDKNAIVRSNEFPNIFEVPSRQDPSVIYTVDIETGVCTCPQGQTGAPCPHQAAITIFYQIDSLSSVPITIAGRQMFAVLAYGENAERQPEKYVSLHQKKKEQYLAQQNLPLSLETFHGMSPNLCNSQISSRTVNSVNDNIGGEGNYFF
jgi:hypothetical protein